MLYLSLIHIFTELLDAPIDVADRPGAADLTDPKGGIEFRHLNFRYPDGEYDVLRDVYKRQGHRFVRMAPLCRSQMTAG